MRALVTGGAGFIGGALVERLVADGHSVTVFDDFSCGTMRWKGDKIGCVSVLNKDIEEIRDLKIENVDWVFHFAGHFANIKSLEQPMENVRVNMLGTMAVLQFCLLNNVKKLMYASSSGVYGAMDIVAYAENMSPRPATPYEVTKYSGEILCDGFSSIYGMSLVSPRFFNVYGPGDLPGPYRCVIPNFYRKALRGEKIEITGKMASRDFTYIEDVVDGILAGVTRVEEAPGRMTLVYNIATGQEVFISKLAGMIVKATGSESKVEIVEQRFWDNALRRVGDVHKFRALFPDQAEKMRRIDKGLKDAHSWYTEVCK